MLSSNKDDEDERTSLLASSTAPPDVTRPRPSLLHPYNPSNPPPSSSQQQPHPYAISSRTKLTQSTLEEMERGAKRLADDNSVNGLDTDSVNGLLAGIMDDDDDSVASSNKLLFGTDNDGGQQVNIQDLEYLSRQRGRRRSSGDVSSDSHGLVKKKIVDEIGNELLDAHDDPRLEQQILNQSLKLVATPQELLDSTMPYSQELVEEDEEMRSRSFQEQSTKHHDSGVVIDNMSKRVHESTRALRASMVGPSMRRVASGGAHIRLPRPPSHPEIEPGEEEFDEKKKGVLPKYFTIQVISMLALMIFVMLVLAAALALGTIAVGPPRQPLGEYQILEAQVGNDFWDFYTFYAGKDSAGSNGYITYVSEKVAREDGIISVVTEVVPKKSMVEIYAKDDPRSEEDWLAEDLAFLDHMKRQQEEEENAEKLEKNATNATDTGGSETESNSTATVSSNSTISTAKKKMDTTTEQKASAGKKKNAARHLQQDIMTDDIPPPKLEPFNPDNTTGEVPTETFVVISSSPTPEGPRNSVRLEGRRRFNRGLFIIDLRHMPAGCGTWPAFWLTDEANWPVNGEIDIVEGVNYQDTAKTALHTTKICQMDDVPEGSKTGSWDTSVGIPDRKTGIPDMTFRWAQNCFVYDPHQWINQGCVATDLKLEGRSLGMPLNQNGGGVYALEWDPVNKHIRTWVFSPHGRVPSNLRDALRTATNTDVGSRVAPDTNQWGLPYGHFPIGEGTNCEAGHFRNMRLVINLAFCGTVAGNRYFMDCPKKHKQFKTCNEWVASNPDELKEAYWKIRGVYVYERAWERQWT